MKQPQITAIICTHNRESYLGIAIDSLLSQTCENYEIIVVDNASRDGTRKVVEARLEDPRLKYVYEPQLGLSVARNRGLQEAKAPLLAYLDDDAVATRDWLIKITQAYAANPQLAIAGGKVTLIWPTGRKRPSWLSDNLAGALGAYDLGNEAILIQDANLTPRGLNYSIRRSFLEGVGGFDVNLGRVGKKLLSNEELYMTELALKQNWQVAYLPEALVAHHVAPERLERSWFLRRSWWQGISEYYREAASQELGTAQITRGGERLARGLYKAVKNISRSDQSFDNFTYAYGQIGYLKLVIQNILWRQNN